jgi:hypothetical protein
MIMRYHRGLAVGHIYGHGQFPSEASASCQVEKGVVDLDNEPSRHEENIASENGEFEYTLQDHDNEFDEWESIDEDAGSVDHQCDHYLSDESDEI